MKLLIPVGVESLLLYTVRIRGYPLTHFERMGPYSSKLINRTIGSYCSLEKCIDITF